MRSFHIFVGALILVCACASPPAAVAGAPSGAAAPKEEQPCFGILLPDSVGAVTYAAGKGWFINNESLRLFGDIYVKFGLPRGPETIPMERTPPEELTFVGTYDGVPLYADRVAMPRPDFIYVPLNADCYFQKYARGELLR